MPNLTRKPSRWWAVVVLLVALAGANARGQSPLPPENAQGTTLSTRLPGQSVTILPDGRWLLLGGEEGGAAKATGSLYDPLSQRSTPLIATMPEARSGHTATVLPDGRVLVLGGFSAEQQVLEDALTFDPATQQFTGRALDDWFPRAEHTATLLTDGAILVVGGISGSGELLREAELIDTLTWHVEQLDAELDAPRFGHLAALMPSSGVLLWGGFGASDQALASGSLYAPNLEQFFSIPPIDVPNAKSLLSEPGALAISGGIPPSGAVDFPVDGRISVRFSRPLLPPSLNPETIVLYGPTGVVTTNVVAAEAGLLLFVTPAQQLLPASQYTLFVSGAADPTGERLPLSAITFRTAAIGVPTGATIASDSAHPGTGSGAGTPAGYDADAKVSPTEKAQAATEDDQEEWIPGPQNLHGYWRSDRKPPQLTTRAKAQSVAEGATALAGLTLRLNGKPLENVTLSLGGKSIKSDSDGRFLLVGIPSGKQTLTIDGATANRPDATYGLFESLVEIVDGQTTTLPYTIWLPKLDTQHTVKIPSPTTEEVVLSTPRIPGFELHIPAGVVIRDRAGKIVTEVGVTAIPLDRTPFPQPFMDFPVYYTVQPGGAVLQGLDATKVQSARAVYPNYTNQPAGQRADFWLYDPVEKGWYVYGQGSVGLDGKSVLPDVSVGLYEFTGGGYSFGPTPPPGPTPCPEGACCSPGGSPPGGGCGGTNWQGGGGNPGAKTASPVDGDPVDLYTGLFVHGETDLTVADVVPLAISRVYRQNSSVLGLFGIGYSTPYDMYIYSANPDVSLNLVLANGGQVTYNLVSGTGLLDGTFRHTGSPSTFYYSTIKLVAVGGGHPDFQLALKDGRKYVFYHHGGKLMSFVDRVGNTTTITRNMGGDYSGAISSIVGPTGRKLTVVNNTDGTASLIKDALGRTWQYGYTNGYLTSVTDPENGVRHYTYDASNRMRTVQDPNGNIKVTNDYDVNGRVSRQTYADGSMMQFAYTLDVNGNVTQTDVTDQRANVRRVAFNTLGYETSNIYPLGKPEQQTTSFARNTSTGFLNSMTDALNRTTAYTYDSLGNRRTTTRLSGTPNAVTTTYTYESTHSQVSSVTDPLGHVWRFTYDAAGNRISASDPLGNTRATTYNGQGQATAIVDPLGNTTKFTYDGNDLTIITDPVDRSTSFSYDVVGRLVQTVSPMGHSSQVQYDKADRTKAATDPLLGQTTFSYDANGNVLSYTDPRGNSSSYTINNLSKQATRTDSLLHGDSTMYDIVGYVSRFTDRKAQVSGATYDNMNRLVQMGFGATVGNPTAYQSTLGYSYDNGNRVTQTVDSVSGSIARTFDDLDRMLLEQTPQGTITYTYDNANRRMTMTVAGQAAVIYTYDVADRLTQVSGAIGAVGFGYDAAGRRISTTLPNGVTINYSYDSADQLLSTTYSKRGVSIGALTYSYDPDGRRIAIGGSLARTTLPQTVPSATYNGNNQLIQWGGIMFTFDLNGNLTSDGSRTYSWNGLNQLISLSGPINATFTYDSNGRRSSKTINGTATSFLYDGMTFVQELAGATPSANLLTGMGLDEPLVRTTAGGTANYLADVLGSVVALTDGGGIVSTSYSYEPYGASTKSGLDSSSQQFTGREDDGNGLLYYRARYYLPATGRFVSEDPIGVLDGANIYRYAEGNPISEIDPTGLQAVLPIIPPPAWTLPGRPGDPVAGPFPIWAQPPDGRRSRGRQDPVFHEAYNAGKDCNGNCNPCPDADWWEAEGDAHGSTGGKHYHWIRWDQTADCWCYPKRGSGPRLPQFGR